MVDYSKWDHIEVSDDEDDTHPNVDTPSLFRWRHEARLQREAEQKKEKEDLKKGLSDHQQKLANIKQKIKEAETNNAAEELSRLKLEVSEVEKQENEFRKKEEDLKKKERLTPWNVDTLCKEGKSKTIINKAPPPKESLTDEERMEMQQEFTEKHEKEIKKFGMLRKYDDSLQFLQDNSHLVCEETCNYLVLWCINLQVQEKSNLMDHVAHQTIVMQFILELAKSLDRDPRACVPAFFSRIKMAEKQYTDAFNDELNSFKDRVRARAQVRLQEAMQEVEEEEREKRLGPGGLDPVEVFESLPKVLQDCFEAKDIPALEKALKEMPKEEAEVHLKRCIDSGMWIPDARAAAENQEEIYEEVTTEEVD